MPNVNESYHSKHGAIQESQHVFIDNGLRAANAIFIISLYLLEVGWGTGLNTLLTFITATSNDWKIHYTALEPYPLPLSIISALNYCELIERPDYASTFLSFHRQAWEKDYSITNHFTLQKLQKRYQDYSPHPHTFHLVYFDAFASRVQPELWTEQVFRKLYRLLKKEGLLVTYSAKGAVKRTLQAIGFDVETLAGPPGKREMTRAIKP